MKKGMWLPRKKTRPPTGDKIQNLYFQLADPAGVRFFSDSQNAFCVGIHQTQAEKTWVKRCNLWGFSYNFFMKKIKPPDEFSNSAVDILSWIFSALCLLSFVMLVVLLLILNILPMRMVAVLGTLSFCILLLLAILLIGFASSKKETLILLGLFVVLSAVFCLGDFYIFKTNNMFEVVSKIEKETNNTVSVYALNDSGIDDLGQLANKKVGYLDHLSTKGVSLLFETLNADGIYTDQISFSNLPLLMEKLYNHEIDAIAISDSYFTNIEDIEEYRFFGSQSHQVTSVSYYTDEVNAPLVVDDITTEPFTIFVSGNDTYGTVDALSRSDVNMLVTINPKTETILLTSLPRDTYTPIVCEPEYGCLNGQYDKLTHAGIHGIQTSKDTVENLLDIDINYTFRVNFSSVIDVVDSLGGIDVFIEEGLAVDPFFTNEERSVHEGWNHLDGQGALALSRERYAYSDGDNQRIRNQRIVLRAILNKIISSQILISYASFMDALSGAFETNLTKEEMTALIQYQLQNMPGWTIYDYSLKGYGQDAFSAELGTYASVQVPDPASIAEARANIEAVLAGKTPEYTDSVEENFAS